jgi:hypothetical protein
MKRSELEKAAYDYLETTEEPWIEDVELGFQAGIKYALAWVKDNGVFYDGTYTLWFNQLEIEEDEKK